jgi:hypothetical protein
LTVDSVGQNGTLQGPPNHPILAKMARAIQFEQSALNGLLEDERT